MIDSSLSAVERRVIKIARNAGLVGRSEIMSRCHLGPAAAGRVLLSLERKGYLAQCSGGGFVYVGG